MAINLAVATKDFAVVTDTGGVPLGDLSTIVGTLVERYRHTETIAVEPARSSASRINYKPLQFAALYRIVVTNSGGTVLLNGTIEAQTWQGLVHAAVGDTLVHDGQPTQTGHRLTPAPGASTIPQTIMVGRTEDNFLLIQGIALPVDTVIDVYSEEFTGGEITERLWRQTAAAPHVLRLKGYFTDQGAAETAARNVGYDGSFATGIDGTNWQEQDEPYAPGATDSGSEFQYRANATYNPLAARWLLSTIDITAVEAGVTVEYGVSDTGPWHSAQADTDKWRRWRDAVLQWHVEPLNELDDGWRFLVSFSWDSSATPDPGIYSEWVKALAFPIQFDDWKYVLLTYTWTRDDYVVQLPIPCASLHSELTSAAAFTDAVARAAQFRRSGTLASWDDPGVGSASRADADQMTIKYQFERQDSENSDRQASMIRIDSASSGKAATLRIFVGR